MGNAVRELRKKNKMLAKELASKIGKSKQWVSELERDNVKLSYEMAVKIAEVFGETPDIFLPIKSE